MSTHDHEASVTSPDLVVPDGDASAIAPDDALAPFVPVATRTLTLTHADVPEAQVAEGTPGTATFPLGTVGDVDLGVWEHTAGSSYDVEVDEVFVVLEGTATVTLLDGDVEASVITLAPGTVCRLAAGSVTRWDVPERLRKIYLIPRGQA